MEILLWIFAGNIFLWFFLIVLYLERIAKALEKK